MIHNKPNNLNIINYSRNSVTVRFKRDVIEYYYKDVRIIAYFPVTTMYTVTNGGINTKDLCNVFNSLFLSFNIDVRIVLTQGETFLCHEGGKPELMGIDIYHHVY